MSVTSNSPWLETSLIPFLSSQPEMGVSIIYPRVRTRAKCKIEGCEKYSQSHRLCKAHGGGSRCHFTMCTKLAQSQGLCASHGGRRRCKFEGCFKSARTRQFCIEHGGGRRCCIPDCEKTSQLNGRCKYHAHLMIPSRDVAVQTSPMPSPVNAKLSITFLLNEETK